MRFLKRMKFKRKEQVICARADRVKLFDPEAGSSVKVISEHLSEHGDVGRTVERFEDSVAALYGSNLTSEQSHLLSEIEEDFYQVIEDVVKAHM